MATSSTKASGLRSTLNTLFQEHIYLAAAATGAALGGRDAEVKAARRRPGCQLRGDLQGHRQRLRPGPPRRPFLPLWRKHIGMVVEYTVGVATNDNGQAGTKAVADLIGYTQDFGAVPPVGQSQSAQERCGRSRPSTTW